MVDPTPVLIASGESSTAITTVNFSAQPAGSALILLVAADDYKTGDPSGWTLGTNCAWEGYLGAYLFHKDATGSETSVQYTIGSAAHSRYAVIACPGATFSVANGQGQTASVESYTTASITPTAGSRYFVLGAILGSTGIDTTGMDTWLNGYTEIEDGFTTTGGTVDHIGAAYLFLDGGSATSTGATINIGANWTSMGGFTAAFTLSAATAAWNYHVIQG